MKKTLGLLTLVLLLGGFLFLTGCGRNTASNTTNESSSEALPTEDAIGEDMDDVERYEDSVRTYYYKDSEETDVIYVTADAPEDVRDFYKDLLVEEGWTLVSEATDYIDFEKGDSDNPEIFTVYYEWKKKKGYTEYELVYMPPLSEEELQEMEELDAAAEEESVVE